MVSMSASRPTAVVDQQAPDGGLASDAELASRLRVAVVRLNRKLRQQSLAGLSPAQASALGTVRRLSNPTLGELAAAEQVQPPTVTRLVANLESAGLVARETDGVDRRVVRVRITAEGRSNLQRIRTLKNAYLNRRLAALDPAEQQLAESMTSLLEHLVADE
jgi:DNA-binding MarR family transcriptional regulator